MAHKSEQIVAMTWQRFGRWVFDKRNEHGWTQEYCAERADMKRQQWQRIEKGASTKRTTVIRVAEALEADSNEALTMAGFQPAISTQAGSGKNKYTVEEALHYAMFFDRKGLSDADLEKLRPLFAVLDREVERLKEKELKSK